MEAEQFAQCCADKRLQFVMDQSGFMTWQPTTPAPQPIAADPVGLPLQFSLMEKGSSAETNSPSTEGCCSSSSQHHKVVGSVMEENMRMRQSITNMAFTMAHLIRGNKDQSERVRYLVEKLNESEQKRKTLCCDLESLKIQTAIRESEWEAERDRLATFQGNHEEKTSKQVIVKLQEENWKLRKTHSRALICRGYSDLSPVKSTWPRE